MLLPVLPYEEARRRLLEVMEDIQSGRPPRHPMPIRCATPFIHAPPFIHSPPQPKPPPANPDHNKPKDSPEYRRHLARREAEIHRWMDLGFSELEAIQQVANERNRMWRRAYAAGATQKTIAEAVGVTPATINQKVSGRRLDASPIERLADIEAMARLMARETKPQTLRAIFDVAPRVRPKPQGPSLSYEQLRRIVEHTAA